ncbi:hypothetical protein HHI36_009705, partial [Cryptolaemus montrouzieri]
EYFNIMASRRVLNEREIASLLNEEDGGSDSEFQEHVSEDNVKSDTDDGYVDKVMIYKNSNDI